MKLNKIDLNKLNTFLQVAERGSVSGAANQLFLTRSAVSQNLASLEASLGLQLFHRVGKKLILTAKGRELLEAVQKSNAILDTALERVLDPGGPLQGLVRVGLFIGFSKAKLTDFLSSFLAEHPTVQVKILFLSQTELAESLRENRIDFALSIYPLNTENSSISSVRLIQEELILVSGKMYFRPRLRLDEIRKLPFIDYYQGGLLGRSWIRHHFGKDAGDLNVRAYGAAIDFVLELVMKDAGVAIVPRYVAEPYLKSKQLHQIRTGRPELVDSIWLNEVRNMQHAPVARLFLDQLRANFK